MPEKAVIYLRVSSDGQWKRDFTDEGYSLPSQRERCLRFIEQRGWEFAGEYLDAGESARSADRPDLKRMLNEIRDQGDISYVVVFKVSRIARNLDDHIFIKASLRNTKTRLASATEPIGDTPGEQLLENMLASFAQYESQNQGLEIKRGKTTKIKMGGWPNRAPLGYLNKRETISGNSVASVILDPDRAPLIREAAERYAKGSISLSRLEERMWERGMRTRSGKRVCRNRWHEIFRNSFYAGRLNLDGVEYQGNHEAMFPPELFVQLERVLELRNFVGRRDVRRFHYLKGSLYCGECGAMLSYGRSKGRSAYYEYFYCLGRKRCPQPHVPIEIAEREVVKLYSKVAMPGETATFLLEQVRETVTSLRQHEDAERKRLERRLAKLDENRTKLLHAHFDDAVPLDLLKKEQNEISRESGRIRRRLETLDSRLEKATADIERALKLASVAAGRYERYSEETRRRFNKAFFDAIYFSEKRLDRWDYSEAVDPVMQTAASLGRGSDKISLVEENGARLNRRRLSDAYRLACALANRCRPEPQSQSQILPRTGAIQAAVIRVLASADQPLRAREIHAAAEKLAGTALSWNTVKDCLHKHARRPDSPIERVSHGSYRLV